MSPEELSDETEEDKETLLEAELQDMAEKKKAVSERIREDDELLRKIREEENRKEAILKQIRLERKKRDAYKVTDSLLAPGLSSERDEFESLKQQYTEQKELLEKQKESMQSITSHSEKQQEEIEQLKQHIKCLNEDNAKQIGRLQDEISAAKQISVETQLRQVNEVESPSQETTELKKTLTELHLQQQPTNEEHRQGNQAYYST